MATLAGAIAVLGSVAGSTAFVMQSMRSAPNPSVSVAPVITLRPAAPKAAPAAPLRDSGPSSPATTHPSTAGPTPVLGASAPASALPGRAILAAGPLPALVHRAVAGLTSAAQTAATEAAGAAQAAAGNPVTVVGPLSPATGGVVAQSLATPALALPSTTPPVAGPRVAKVNTVRSLNFVTPRPLVAPLAVARARARTHLAAAAARAVRVGNPSARATVALSRFNSARKTQGGGHRLWAETDGLNGPSTHH